MGSQETFIEAVVDAWTKDPVIQTRGSTTTKVCLVSRTKIDRSDVRENCAVLIPVIKFLGLKPNICMLREATRIFLWRTRPRGKPDVTSTMAVVVFFKPDVFAFNPYDIILIDYIIYRCRGPPLMEHIPRNTYTLADNFFNDTSTPLSQRCEEGSVESEAAHHRLHQGGQAAPLAERQGHAGIV